MLPLALLVPLALVSLQLVVPWPSASDVGLLPVLVPSDWAPDAVMSRRLASGYQYDYDSDSDNISDVIAGLVDNILNNIPDVIADNIAVFVFMVAALIYIIYIVVFVSIAGLYKEKVTERRPPLQGGSDSESESDSCTSTNDFAIGVFSCFDHMPTCMHAWCCMYCRAADTYQGAGIAQYWGVVFYFIGAGFVGYLVNAAIRYLGHIVNADLAAISYLGHIVNALVVGALLQRYRRKLRTRLGGREEGGPNIFVDVLLYGFCTCCVVAQEARELDTATGVEVECCCKLNSAATGQPLNAQPLLGGQPQPLVGQPVYEHVA